MDNSNPTFAEPQTQTAAPVPEHDPPPGAEHNRRGRIKIRYELLGCGLHGHHVVGRDAAQVTPADGHLVRDDGVVRWHRCLRCDTWLGLARPQKPKRDGVPSRDEIKLPLRGRPLRDRYVLRVIAVDRMLHFLVLTAFGVAIVLFAHDRARLKGDYTRILNAIQGAAGGPLFDTNHNSIMHDINHLFTIPSSKLYLIGAAVIVYGAINGIEAVGLWSAKRWAEYLTMFELAILLPIEVYELSLRMTPLKIVTLVLNVLIIGYLAIAHRLLGLRGGHKAHHAALERDMGWQAVERHTPGGALIPQAVSAAPVAPPDQAYGGSVIPSPV